MLPPNQIFFQQVLDHLISTDPGGGELLLMSQAVALVGGVEGPVVVAWVPEGQGAKVRADLLTLMEHMGRGRQSVVLCADEAEQIDVIGGAPILMRPCAGVLVVEMEAEGQRLAGPPSPMGEWLGAALGAVQRRPGVLPLPAEAWSQRMGSALQVQKRRYSEMVRFARAMEQRRPWLSGTIVAVLGLVFLLTEMGEVGEQIVEAGLLLPGAKSYEQPWRLLASTALHGGFAHVALNGFAIWDLGGLIERLVGPRRLLVLYTVSGLGGALVASATLAPGSAALGASGAAFGLMGAAGWLSFRGADLFPADVARRLRRLTLQSLVINGLVSLLPNISLSSHLGGALAGLTLAGSGLLFAGLRRPEPGVAADPDGDQGGWALAAGSLGALLVGSVGAVILLGLL